MMAKNGHKEFRDKMRGPWMGRKSKDENWEGRRRLLEGWKRREGRGREGRDE